MNGAAKNIIVTAIFNSKQAKGKIERIEKDSKPKK